MVGLRLQRFYEWVPGVRKFPAEFPSSEQAASSPPALSEDQQATHSRETAGTSTIFKGGYRQDWQHLEKSFHKNYIQA